MIPGIVDADGDENDKHGNRVTLMEHKTADHFPWDILIIGGGINGCGIARDAAGRGFSVYLAEMSDLASGTSSGSSKLIHGGLRYLEHYEFRLVREALAEREVLWKIAPHIISPLRFVLPLRPGLRSAWMLRLGLFLYDHLGPRRQLAASKTESLPDRGALLPRYRRAYEYSDCRVDDTRLTVLNARDAADRGATISPRTKVIGARRADGLWAVTLADQRAPQKRREIRARMIVNAAGPWIDQVLGQTGLSPAPAKNVRMVKGSHIVVTRITDDERAFVLQNSDGRIVFAIPFEQDFTLIGTTDIEYDGDPLDVAISEEEVRYLCDSVNAYFSREIASSDIVWAYSAIRPLYNDGASKAQEVTRDYVLRLDDIEGAPVLNIFGGKLTTYRRLAEAALSKIEERLGPRSRPWTANAPLPGGAFATDGFDAEVRKIRDIYPFLTLQHARRLVRSYGTLTSKILGPATSHHHLGRHFGDDLYEAEVRYLMANEWAMNADDILWRRTKCGLRMSPAEAAALDSYIAHTCQQNDEDARDRIYSND